MFCDLKDYMKNKKKTIKVAINGFGRIGRAVFKKIARLELDRGAHRGESALLCPPQPNAANQKRGVVGRGSAATA